MTNPNDQKYEVTIRKAPNTGYVIWESWERSDGARYNPTGPAVRHWDETNGELIEELWHNEQGRWHREDNKPAWIHRDPDTKVITREEYYIDGQHHRRTVNAPTLILRDEKAGKIIYEEYKFWGKLNRTGLPAIIITNPETDVIVREEYWNHGYRHKSIDRDSVTGDIIKVEHGPEKKTNAAPVAEPF